MRGFYILLLLVTLQYAVLCCEDETHYAKDGKCCRKCGPGKRMLVDDNCEDPRCQECGNGEYQSGYTTETKCQRQPSCDPNLYFKQVKNPDKTTKLTCECESGYYCSRDDDCSACRKQTVCIPGQKIAKQGSSFSDTVCMTCENGTFSTEQSAISCTKWTECGYGYAEDTPASSTSDRTCVGIPMYKVAVVLVVVALVLIPVIAAAIFIKKKGKYGCYQYHKQTLTDRKAVEVDEEVVAIAVEPIVRQPQEDDDLGPVSPTPSNRTENGNVVEQEYGKEALFPSHESDPYANSVP